MNLRRRHATFAAVLLTLMCSVGAGVLLLTNIGTHMAYGTQVDGRLEYRGVSGTFLRLAQDDEEGPEIVVWHTPDDIEVGSEIVFYVSVGDPSGVDTVIISTSLDGSTWVNHTMEYLSDYLVYKYVWGNIQYGQRLYYKAYANDTLGNWNVSETYEINAPGAPASTEPQNTLTTTTTSEEEDTGEGTGIPLSLLTYVAGGVGVIVLVVVIIFLQKFRG
ncbi:MAG: hypothetical protein ACTSYX_02675 [Candidatus Thorarchaeota archaeon]